MVKRLQERLPDTFNVAVSHTTRKRRDTELPNIHYYFVTKEQFESDINSNKFVEYVLYDNEYYGTSFKSIENIKESKSICLLEIDVFGAEKIKKEGKLECNYLFISTSDGLDTLKERMKIRNTESEQEIQRRLETGKKEMQFLINNPNFFDSVIYNDKDINETFYLLTEQFINWYPSLKQKLTDSQDTKVDDNKKEDYHEYEDNDKISTLSNVNKIIRISKRQSMDLYADFRVGGKGMFITNESLCRDILNSAISPIQHNDHIIGIIVEYTDISPKNRRKQWKSIDEFSVIINKLKDSVEHRWTIGNNIDFYPLISMDTINEIYFAYHEKIMNGYIFYLCGTIKCPNFAKFRL